MPELPEVETVRRILEPRIKGKTISDVCVNYWRMIKSDHDTFITSLIGQTFSSIDRRGKFLIFQFESDLVLISHLRMEGKYINLEREEPDSDYARVIFYFQAGDKLNYDDSRCFGTMQLSTRSRYLNEAPLTHVGPEPFNIEDPTYLLTKYGKSQRPIKELLLDQTIMTGLGNIYVDEVLFLSRIHPELPGTLLTIKEAGRLLKNSQEVLRQAIEAGGSTIRSYHAAKGVDGRFQHSLYAYDRVGKPCVRCHTPLAKIKVKGRGSTFCPRCQINRSKPLVIAVTGTMHAGKSTVIDVAHDLGYPTISSDELVKQLYKRPDAVTAISKLLKIEPIEGKLDREAMLQVILNDPAAKRRLEKWVHPKIKQTVIDWIKVQTSTHVFIEVPLLFEAKWDYLAQYIIGVTTTFEEQKRRIIDRYDEPNLALALAQTSQFPSYQKNVDDLLFNDVPLDQFKVMALNAVKKAIEISVKTANAADF